MSREVANFRTFWKATTFSSILEPIVYLLAFGLGLGATLVDRVDGLSDVEELVTAEMLWIGLRSSVYGCFPLIVSMAFGLDPAPGMLLVPLFAFFTSLIFSAFGIAVAASVAKIDQFNYVTTLFITPLFLVAGTFFPIDQLPEGVQVASQLNPLHHLVELVRHASFGFETTDLLRVAFLIVVALALWRVAVRRMETRLID